MNIGKLFASVRKKSFPQFHRSRSFPSTSLELLSEQHMLRWKQNYVLFSWGHRRRAISSLIPFKTLMRCQKSTTKISKHHGKCLRTPHPFFCWFHTISVKTQKHMGSMPGRISVPWSMKASPEAAGTSFMWRIHPAFPHAPPVQTIKTTRSAQWCFQPSWASQPKMDGEPIG